MNSHQSFSIFSAWIKHENGKQRFLLCPKMAHSERRGEAVAMNIYGEQDMKLFESGVAYFK